MKHSKERYDNFPLFYVVSLWPEGLQTLKSNHIVYLHQSTTASQPEFCAHLKQCFRNCRHTFKSYSAADAEKSLSNQQASQS